MLCRGKRIPCGPYFCMVFPEIEWPDSAQFSSQWLYLLEHPRPGGQTEGLPLPLVSLVSFLSPLLRGMSAWQEGTRPRPYGASAAWPRVPLLISPLPLRTRWGSGCLVSVCAGQSSNLPPQALLGPSGAQCSVQRRQGPWGCASGSFAITLWCSRMDGVGRRWDSHGLPSSAGPASGGCVFGVHVTIWEMCA